MTTDWKNHHANEASKALDHALVAGVIDELLDNISANFGERAGGGLTRYGVTKVAMYAAQVARAQVLGIDPDLLRMTPDEANSELMRTAAEAALLGVPVHMIEMDRPPQDV